MDESAKILYKVKNAVRTSASAAFVSANHWMKRRWSPLRPDTADEIYGVVVGGEAGGLDIKKTKLFRIAKALQRIGDGARGMFFIVIM